MSDLTDAQFAAYVDRILECRKAEDAAKEDTKQAYANLKDAGGDKTEAGLLVRALRMDEKDAGKAKAREDMLEEARLRYRRGKASHVRAREAGQSYTEAKGRGFVASLTEEQKAEALAYRGNDTHGELTDTQEQPETRADNGANIVTRHLNIQVANSQSAGNSPSKSGILGASSAENDSEEISAPIPNPQPSSSPASGAALSEKKDCLKLKDGHCRISFQTSALCSECNDARNKVRASA